MRLHCPFLFYTEGSWRLRHNGDMSVVVADPVGSTYVRGLAGRAFISHGWQGSARGAWAIRVLRAHAEAGLVYFV